MKKKCLLIILVIMGLFAITGCEIFENNSIKLEKGNFSIICSVDNGDIGGIKQKTKTTYNFNEEQYVINYSVVTTQKFKDKSVYEEYKEAQEETVANSSNDVIFDLKTNDFKKTLIFTMAITNIDVNNAENEEEKSTLKASSILRSNEEATDGKHNCKIEGIDRSKLK